MLKVNRVDVTNLDELSKIDIDNFEDAWNREMFKSELEYPLAEYFGLFDNDKLIGFCGGWLVAGEYQVNKVVVDKEYQNKKLGQHFFNYVLEFLKTRGVESALVEVRVSNMPAITVYKKSGFEIVDIRKNYYKNNGEDAYVMIRNFKNE